jgi:hypothetical protein
VPFFSSAISSAMTPSDSASATASSKKNLLIQRSYSGPDLGNDSQDCRQQLMRTSGLFMVKIRKSVVASPSILPFWGIFFHGSFLFRKAGGTITHL